MTDKPRLSGLMGRMVEVLRDSYDRDRRANPERFNNIHDGGLGPEFLFVGNVARMLGCGVDHVRRIPRQELPASKVGTRLIYARADVERYIASRRDAGTDPALVRPRAAKALPNPHAPKFDPVAKAKLLLTKGKK